jgi:hypothetical protein
MDLLKRRAGKWVVVRSGGARTTAATTSKGNSAPAGNPTAVNTVNQLEQDIGNAMVDR